MITDEDVKKLAKKFATKEDLAKQGMEVKWEIDKLREEMATKDDFRRVMTMLDKVLIEHTHL